MTDNTTAIELPQTLIDATKNKNVTHRAMRQAKTRKEIKTTRFDYECIVEIYRTELVAFTGVDNQAFFNSVMDALDQKIRTL